MALAENLEERQVGTAGRVEAGVGTVGMAAGFTEPEEVLGRRGGRLHGGEGLEVAAISRLAAAARRGLRPLAKALMVVAAWATCSLERS